MSEELHDRQTDWSNRLAWFLTGAIIGATAAILYAPKSGKETRQYITDKTQQGREAVTDTVRISWKPARRCSIAAASWWKMPPTCSSAAANW